MELNNEQIERVLNEKYAAYLALSDKKDRLWELVQSFIIENRVSHAAMIRSVGSIKEQFPSLVERIADIVGYFTFQEDETVTGK